MFDELFLDVFKNDIGETFEDFPIENFDSTAFTDKEDDHWNYHCSFDYKNNHYDFTMMIVLSTKQMFYNLMTGNTELYMNDSISLTDYVSYIAFLLDVNEMMKENLLDE